MPSRPHDTGEDVWLVDEGLEHDGHVMDKTGSGAKWEEGTL